MPTFEDLRIWQASHQLMEKVFKLCKNLPRDERFRLRDQIERSSSSVCDNIAEGYSAYYYNEKIKIFYIARREAGETQNHIRSMQTRGYVTKCIADDLFHCYEEVKRGINGYVKYIVEKRNKKVVK